MKNWRLLLGIVIVFIVVDAILFFFLFAKTSKTSIGFVSLKPVIHGILINLKKKNLKINLLKLALIPVGYWLLCPRMLRKRRWVLVGGRETHLFLPVP